MVNDVAPTVELALANAARLLHNAESETNLALMERLEKLADSWIGIASMLVARERG
jgi:hypothetical protein